MTSDDSFDYDADEDGERSPMGGADAPNSRSPGGSRDWMSGKRGWFVIAGLAIIQAVFASIIISLRSGTIPESEAREREIRDLAVEMLGYEVGIRQIYQLVRAPNGRRMTIGLDVVLVLGQLPEERIDGAPWPTPEEFAVFIDAAREMEPGVRSEVNSLLQRIPIRDLGTTAAHRIIKDNVRDYVNDRLERLDFGKAVRPGIGKRRVTEVLLPMFVRQELKT